jgi:Uma2 family endonuclease
MVIAGEPEYFNDRTDTIINPQVIIEVLSKSTQGYDRSGKFSSYRTIPTFQEYLLLDTTKIAVEHFSKIDAKRWSFCEYDESDQTITLSSVDFQISLADVYNKVKFVEEDAEGSD